MKKQKTLSDVKEMTDEQLQAALEDLPPKIHDAIKDRTDQIPREILLGLVQKVQIPRKAMIRYQIPFDRHQMRQLAVESVYQHLLLDKDIKKCLYDVLLGSNQADGFLYSLAVDAAENEEALKEALSSRLRDDWGWDRLSKLEQAILLVSAEEITSGMTPKAVAINEAVTLAKEYCDDSSPAMINGILDSLQ